MNRDKQIEEMAEIIGQTTDFDTMWDEIYASANALYTAGYRKSTDLAREIFEEIEEARQRCRRLPYGWALFKEMIAELKKKYTEGK